MTLLESTRDPSATSPVAPVVAGAPPGPAAVPSPGRASVVISDNDLLLVRLGMASSLFTALRCRHAGTASHSLRVTLQTASWALQMGMSDEQRDVIEVAALLHDVGKIGVPDAVLLKPGPLTPEESNIMEQHRRQGLEILRNCCGSQALLDVVGSCGAWYDGSSQRVPLAGDAIPLAARMLAIADAFDAMTTDQVYRRALSRERALAELFRFAGTQFDPELVNHFAKVQKQPSGKIHEHVIRRWLQALDLEKVNGLWRLNLAPVSEPGLIPEHLFRERLIDNMRDAVAFVDVSLRILLWNPGAERLTGITATSIFQHRFAPSLLEMRDADGVLLLDSACPVAEVIRSGEQRMRRLMLRGRSGKQLTVDAQIMPVFTADGVLQGAALLLHDVSPEMSLEARCQSLHQMATKDPLTQVANRAEFNRVHELFVLAHLERNLPCSLIIADIDHFKRVNDTYGHPAGDEVLQAFARLLKSSCRPGDLVARYGGEEFVMLCADCTNAVATRRADSIRRALELTPHHALGGRCVTASFGVTEIQPGDTPDTMLARADRALYDAKEGGRNRVVQLGTSLTGSETSPPASGSDVASRGMLVEQRLITTVPCSVAIEKLRGFVSDHHASIVSVEGGRVRLKIGEAGGLFRRASDRRIPFFVDLAFEEGPASPKDGAPRSATNLTRIHVAVALQRSRDRRQKDVFDKARHILASVRAYLMAADDIASPEELAAEEKPKKSVLPWLTRSKG
jgi:diguanylate cyclase (GGDEF)-like protein/putative nucleotidyltransferase with HDIG domain